MKYLIISCSLNADSKSRILAKIALEHLAKSGEPAEIIDLMEYELPLCDGGERCYQNTNVELLTKKIKAAKGIILAVPIYNFNINAAAKNLIELTGDAWENKVVGFICAAGGEKSYMSVMGLANSMMLDFRCIIIPRFVYTVSADFDGTRLLGAEITERIRELVGALVRLSRASKGV